jgi:hypothetical protein
MAFLGRCQTGDSLNENAIVLPESISIFMMGEDIS